MAELIHAARTRLGLTGEDFGDLLGVRGNQVSRWERAQALPSRKRAARLAEVCERSEDEVSDLISRAVAEARETRQDMLLTVTRNQADLAHAIERIEQRLHEIEAELQALRTASRRKTS